MDWVGREALMDELFLEVVAVKCLRCGKEEAVSESQRMCFDCLLKTTPKVEWKDTKPGNLMMGEVRLTLVEDYGDVKVYESTDKALSRRR